MMGILFKNGILITAGDMLRADVLVEGETVALIGSDLPAGWHQVVDCTGKYLLPGGVDAHTHLHLPLAQTAANDDFFTGHRAAAFGGTTTHIDFVIQEKGRSLRDVLNLWRRKAEIAQIDYAFHMTITDPTDDALAELPAVVDEGVTSIKLLMAYKGSVMVDDVGMFRVMRAASKLRLPVLVHCENGDWEYEMRRNLLAHGRTEPFAHALSRPPLVETEATHRAIALAGLTGCVTYIVHMTCEGSVEALRRGRAAGYPVMGETCPQYLFLTAEDHLDQPEMEGARYVCSPPLRAWRDHTALWQALRDGTLQVVATDHCSFWNEGGIGPWREWAAAHTSHDWADYEAQCPTYRRPGKELGNPADGGTFATIPNGLPGIEDRLKLLWHHGVNGRRITPQRFVELNCTNPAKIFGLYPRKGTLAPGSDADVVVWDPNAEYTISAETHHMKTDYNPYEGVSGRGAPAQVYLRGVKLVDITAGEAWSPHPVGGRELPRAAGALVL